MLSQINLTHPTRLVASISVVALTISLAACGGQKAPDKAADGGTTTAGSDKLALNQNVRLLGAGATFPAPLYQRWFADLNKETRAVSQILNSPVSSTQICQNRTFYNSFKIYCKFI